MKYRNNTFVVLVFTGSAIVVLLTLQPTSLSAESFTPDSIQKLLEASRCHAATKNGQTIICTSLERLHHNPKSKRLILVHANKESETIIEQMGNRQLKRKEADAAKRWIRSLKMETNYLPVLDGKSHLDVTMYKSPDDSCELNEKLDIENAQTVLSVRCVGKYRRNNSQSLPARPPWEIKRVLWVEGSHMFLIEAGYQHTDEEAAYGWNAILL